MKTEKLIYILIGCTLFFSMIGTCTSCGAKKAAKETSIELKKHIDSISATMYTQDELDLMLQIQGLKDERRTVLNINQIFLTKKRPDERVIEIDREVGKLEGQLKNIQKQKK